ncbi:hypothetical protein CEP53_005998 [Fusarium sp. AF-6]|nr:hypothetical protein CEP53_005998 [Fusarium sp. AF-6]
MPQDLLFSVQRADNSAPLRYCMGAFEDIIAQCIEGAGLWGGFWALDGEVYYINNSGAARYLQNFLATNGDDNWFFAMEHATTNDQGTPELPSCGEIESHNCSPSKDCREYTSTEFYYISEIEGSQFIDDDCYAVSSGCGVLVYDYMDAEDIKLLPGKYGIDMVEFFKSVRECSEHGGGLGFVSSTEYPACFFSLDFKETNRYYQEKCSIHHGPFDQPCVNVPYYDPPCC